MNFDSFPKIERTRTLQGRFIPGVINNGGSHFFINLEVFEDGLIDCWEMVDLELFKKKIESGWVSPNIPNGKQLSVHHLGSWTVTSGEWIFNQESYLEHVKDVVRDLNPTMQNLYDCHGTTTKKVGKVKVSVLGMAKGKPVRRENDDNYFAPKHKGDNFHAFLYINDLEYSLASINIFADSKIQISGIEKTQLVTIDEFRELVSTKKIVTCLPKNSSVTIYGFGKCTIGSCRYSADIHEKVNELNDIITELNGNKTTSVLCREVYDEYVKNPTVKLRNDLRKAYENIPKHLRTYVLGDMDLKDIPVRMIIYGDDEIENWSHYAVSKERGFELPTLTVPKPKDEEK